MASPPSSSPSPSSSSSSPSIYPSSYSSLHSPPLLHTNLTTSSWSPASYPSPTFAAHDQLESLIARHGHPTRVSLSSLDELTATSSTYNPPSPPGPFSPTASETSDPLDSGSRSRSLSRSVSRPIPIPKRSSIPHDPDVPVTPLTGRFDKGYYFAHREELFPPVRDSHGGRQPHRRSRPLSSRMRSDNSTFYSPVVSSSMSPTTTRPASPQPSRPRTQNTAKSVPAFHLGTLPRFHPAVYQSSGTSQNLSSQPPSPRQPRQNLYRTSSGSRDTVWHYRDLMDSVTIPKAPSRPLSPGPSAPRLDPLRSPGPVTPLALEEASGYLVTSTSQSSDQHSGPAPDLIERLIARENDRIRQQAKKATKNR
ncbi:hypothetical protein BDV59DRAFT_10940 [Aspergillus ambiguus]|uniref:uncharacterized protein n=1 Tax=Aspergillus ambiguus TaxID=176160 RepID=UPI003CCDCE8A